MCPCRGNAHIMKHSSIKLAPSLWVQTVNRTIDTLLFPKVQ